MAEKKRYDSTVARIAGNIASGLASGLADPQDSAASFAEGIERISKSVVCLARAIVAETERTEAPPADALLAERQK